MLLHLVIIRLQELDGFIDGLFGTEESINLPENVHQAIATLAEIRSMLASITPLLESSNKTATSNVLSTLTHHMKKITALAETEINKINLLCTRAHHQLVEKMPISRPSYH